MKHLWIYKLALRKWLALRNKKSSPELEDNALAECDREYLLLDKNERELSEHIMFDDIEEYKNILKSWRNFHKENKHVKYRRDYKGSSYIRDDNGNYIGVQTHDQYEMVSDLMAVHHLIYAVIKGKDLSKMFSKECLRLLTYRKLCFYRNKHYREGLYKQLKIPFGDSLSDNRLDIIISFLEKYCKMNNIDSWISYATSR